VVGRRGDRRGEVGGAEKRKKKTPRAGRMFIRKTG